MKENTIHIFHNDIHYSQNETIKSLFLIINSLKEFIIINFLILVLFSGTMYFGSYLWVSYSGDSVCCEFINKYIYISYNIAYLFSHNLWNLALQIMVILLLVCMTTAIICNFFLINQYFYEVTGLIGRLLFWILPNALIASYFIDKLYIFDFKTSLIICFLPTIIVNHQCIKLTSAILPDLGDIHYILVKTFHYIFKRS